MQLILESGHILHKEYNSISIKVNIKLTVNVQQR